MSDERNSCRINITRKVTGKMEAGGLVLYHNRSPVGKINMQTGEVEIYDGYTMEDNHIYAVGDHRVFQNHYAHNCDMGWCP
ncbi:DUF2553 family protein [Lihuaxuella thermophila]|uniref:Uncharacterized protein n=1 Tax=Lihuaxuella thermophila TaxID=1173111 RepID=A0A1H8C8A7_9BACL|nr:DUF2553 family protein [Lihuaxuella thermophila]SEM90327.1 Protein of unknown function [Lihuaxuella thermophila]